MESERGSGKVMNPPVEQMAEDTTSFKFSGQNSLILLYRYHWRWLERPDG